MDFKKLKVATKRMVGYTGVLGPVRFVDGVSTEPLPRHIRDRMAAAMEFVEVDQDGNEQPAGAQYRLLRETAERAPVRAPLERQSEDEKKKELIAAALAAHVSPDIRTREELEKVAEDGGIKALRVIAEKWSVKHRSIPVLIEMILAAQEKFVAAREKRLAEKATAEFKKIHPPKEVEKSPSDDEQTDLFDGLDGKAKAAATGDLSAALDTADDAETLLGSSVLASTYEIGGETVQLGDIVTSAFETFGGTMNEWNGLDNDDREDLLRIELDRRLAAE